MYIILYAYAAKPASCSQSILSIRDLKPCFQTKKKEFEFMFPLCYAENLLKKYF